MDIIVDYREARSPVAIALSRISEVMLKSGHLNVGDYLIDGRILFERKTLGDLAQSIKDGRLFSQASRLASSSLQCAVILEGTSESLRGSKIRREAIQGAIISLTLKFRIPVLRSMDPPESALLMLYASRQMRPQSQPLLRRTGKRPHGLRKIQLHLLQGFPGIGPVRAEHLLQELGTIRTICNVDEITLANVRGIGSRTAKKILRVLEGEGRN